MDYCSAQHLNPMAPTVVNVIEFLTALFHCGLGYSAMNTARSALSTFVVCDNKPVGQHPLVIRFLKGVYQLRPALPRNEVTWDPRIVLTFLRKWSPVKTLSLRLLSLKLVTLFALLSGQRTQGLHLLDVRNISISKNSVRCRFGDLLKHSRPGKHQTELILKAFAPDRRLCIVTVLSEYLCRTKPIRKDTRLFLSCVEPHRAVTKDTISRWLKQTLNLAGVDMTIFTPHSTRAASTSAATRAKVPVETILKTAGWTRNSTFACYYKKPLMDGRTLGAGVLDCL